MGRRPSALTSKMLRDGLELRQGKIAVIRIQATKDLDRPLGLRRKRPAARNAIPSDKPKVIRAEAPGIRFGFVDAELPSAWLASPFMRIIGAHWNVQIERSRAGGLIARFDPRFP